MAPVHKHERGGVAELHGSLLFQPRIVAGDTNTTASPIQCCASILGGRADRPMRLAILPSVLFGIGSLKRSGGDISNIAREVLVTFLSGIEALIPFPISERSRRHDLRAPVINRRQD